MVWNPITNGITVAGGSFSATINTGERAQFFRLRKAQAGPLRNRLYH
jgi:hypothetical protein